MALTCDDPVLFLEPREAMPLKGPVPEGDYRIAFGKAIGSEARLSQVEADDATLTDRYVQRSRLMRFPDTIVVRFFDRPGGRSTIALYSRSQLGEGDMGVQTLQAALP